MACANIAVLSSTARPECNVHQAEQSQPSDSQVAIHTTLGYMHQATGKSHSIRSHLQAMFRHNANRILLQSTAFQLLLFQFGKPAEAWYSAGRVDVSNMGMCSDING